MGPKSNDWCDYKKAMCRASIKPKKAKLFTKKKKPRLDTCTKTYRKGHESAIAEAGAAQLQALLKPASIHQKPGSQGRFFPRTFRGDTDFSLRDAKAVRP